MTFFTSDQLVSILASLISGALSSILSALATNWVFTLFHLPASSALSSSGY